MRPVSFVRTSPTALGELPDTSGAICDMCGGTIRGAADPLAGSGYRNPLSLDGLFVRHPSATYFVQVAAEGDGGISENTYLGVRTGDVLMIDRARDPAIGALILAVCEGELTLCRYTEHEGVRYLVCGERNSKPREVREGLSVWGVVGAVCRRL